jgi:hypothetical protein
VPRFGVCHNWQASRVIDEFFLKRENQLVVLDVRLLVKGAHVYSDIVLLLGRSGILGTLALKPDIQLEDNLLPHVVMQANLTVNEDILHGL